MEQTIKAILARFDGDVEAAIIYCAQMSCTYPKLAIEYDMVGKALIAQELK